MSCAARQKDIHENVTFKMKVKMIRAAQSLMIATARKMSSAARKTSIQVDAKSKTTQPSQSPTVFNVTRTITARGQTSIQDSAKCSIRTNHWVPSCLNKLQMLLNASEAKHVANQVTILKVTKGEVMRQIAQRLKQQPAKRKDAKLKTKNSSAKLKTMQWVGSLIN